MHINTERAFREAMESLGAVGLVARSTEDSPDFVLDIDGHTVIVELKRASVVSPAHVQALLADIAPDPAVSSAIPLLVADRISAAARQLLTEHGWSWIDLRGHLHVRAAGVRVDTDFPPRAEIAIPRSAGRAWREVCFALLREPEKSVGVRELARSLEFSPAAVSGALTQLRDASLLDRAGRPLVPELFWALAERWEVKRVALIREPSPNDFDLELGLEGSDERGWALTDTLAAAAYGARIGVGSGWPPDFYVPDAMVLRRAVRVLGRADSWDTRGATAAVASVRQVCLSRREPPKERAPGTQWFLADPLAVALDLAQDTSRGVELLRDWTPREGIRVWA